MPRPVAADYRFTNALPVQVFKHLLPALQPLFARSADGFLRSFRLPP